MRAHLGFVILGVLLSTPGFALAGKTIASPPVFCGVLPSPQAACYIRNVGPLPVAITVQVTGENGTPRVPSFENCNGSPLAAGRTCVVLAPLVEYTQFAACSATASGSAKRLRGTVEVRDGFFTVVSAQDLR